jgi:hypothetical protein
MRVLKFSAFTILALLCAGVSQGFATQFGGGYSLVYTQKAQLLSPGELRLTLHTRAYSKVIQSRDFTLYDGTGALSANFGFSRAVELGLTVLAYQDLNLSQKVINGVRYQEQIPDDVILHAKFGGWGFPVKSSAIRLAFDLNYRLRTALVREDVYLEPYSSDALEFGLNALVSLYTNAFYPDEYQQVHLNIGYLNHNDAGLGRGLFNSGQEFLYSVGYVYPTLRFDVFGELHGSHFMELPPPQVFSREDYMYVSPGMTYKPFYGFHIQFAMEWLILNEKNTTVGQVIPPDYPANYPPWRISGNLILSPTTSFFRQPTFARVTEESRRRERLLEQAGVDRRALFEWVTDEDFGKEYIDLELEKIRQERQKAEEELNKLKEELGK